MPMFLRRFLDDVARMPPQARLAWVTIAAFTVVGFIAYVGYFIYQLGVALFLLGLLLTPVIFGLYLKFLRRVREEAANRARDDAQGKPSGERVRRFFRTLFSPHR